MQCNKTTTIKMTKHFLGYSSRLLVPCPYPLGTHYPCVQRWHLIAGMCNPLLRAPSNGYNQLGPL